MEMPKLREKLPKEHGLANQTPLEIMAACSQKRMPEGFTNRPGDSIRFGLESTEVTKAS